MEEPTGEEIDPQQQMEEPTREEIEPQQMEEPQIGVKHRNEEFEFAEEACVGQEDNDEDSHLKHAQQWWASVNQACEEGVGGEDGESDGIRSESELESLYD